MGDKSGNVSRREFMKQTGRGTAAVALAGGMTDRTSSMGSAKRPNIVFVFDDQLRADACGVYGGQNISTPHIDQMAKEGLTFTNALSTCPLCTPYRGMLMTGRYGTHTGIVTNFLEANPNQHCLAHLFGEAGYHTGFIGKWHLSAGPLKMVDKHEAKMTPKYADQEAYLKAHPEEHPYFDYIPPGERRLGFDHWQAYNFHCEFNKAWYFEDERAKLVMDGFEIDAETTMAINFMKKHQDSPDPFFLAVAPHPPHPPFSPASCPTGYLERIREDLVWAPNVPEDHPRRADPLEVRCYYAMAKSMDDNVGRLLRFLDASGLSENTIFVFTSDHGEQHGSHGRVDKMVPYAESVNLPLIVRWPGHVPAGTQTDVLQTPLDYLPTLCSLAGLEVPDTADGQDLSPVVLGTGSVDRDAVLMMNYSSHWDYFQSGTQWPEWRGVRTKQHTYAKWLDGKEELYDNAADPHQMSSLAVDSKHAEPLEWLRGRLHALLAEAHDDFLPGTAYADWYDDERNLIKTALGSV